MPPVPAIREQLDKLLNSQALAGSDQLKRLLRVSVERTLDGQGDSTKEYTLGVEAFGRSEGYDPKTDPIVRVQARRLRTKLHEYYAGEGAGDPIVIDIPKGGYIPAFRARPPYGHEPLGFRWPARFDRPRASLVVSVPHLRPAKYRRPANSQLYRRPQQAVPRRQDHRGADHLPGPGAFAQGCLFDNKPEVCEFRASLPEIARALSVRWVVEGGMGFERGQVLLKLRAVDGLTDRKGWADAFRSDIDNLSSTQAKAAAAIVEAVSRKH